MSGQRKQSSTSIHVWINRRRLDDSSSVSSLSTAAFVLDVGSSFLGGDDDDSASDGIDCSSCASECSFDSSLLEDDDSDTADSRVSLDWRCEPDPHLLEARAGTNNTIVRRDDAAPVLPPRRCSSKSSHTLKQLLTAKQAKKKCSKLYAGLQRYGPRMPRRQLSNVSSKSLGSMIVKEQQQQQQRPMEQEGQPEQQAKIAPMAAAEHSTGPSEPTTEQTLPESTKTIQGEQDLEDCCDINYTKSYNHSNCPMVGGGANFRQSLSLTHTSSREEEGSKSMYFSERLRRIRALDLPATPSRRKLPARLNQPRIQRLARRPRVVRSSVAAARTTCRRMNSNSSTVRRLMMEQAATITK